MNKPSLITDIQRCSVHDGPGIRTTIFFKGCPLKCIWCHNPECISFNAEILSYPEKCIGCGMCDEGCFSGAKVVCGKEMTTEEIFKQILMDKPYFGKYGGVTFSGGEALAHPEMLAKLIKLCKSEGIHTAIETSLYIFNEDILKQLDFVMADLKIWDDEKHRQYTGVSNVIIKENFKKLDNLNVPFVVRTPLIPNITDSVENISKIRDFVKDFKNIRDYELLEYNPLGESKNVALGNQRQDFGKPANTFEILKTYARIN